MAGSTPSKLMSPSQMVAAAKRTPRRYVPGTSREEEGGMSSVAGMQAMQTRSSRQGGMPQPGQAVPHPTDIQVREERESYREVAQTSKRVLGNLISSSGLRYINFGEISVAQRRARHGRADHRPDDGRLEK